MSHSTSREEEYVVFIGERISHLTHGVVLLKVVCHRTICLGKGVPLVPWKFCSLKILLQRQHAGIFWRVRWGSGDQSQCQSQ